MTYSKRLSFLKKKITENFYNIDTAVPLLKETANANFLESVETHIRLNIDVKQIDQQLRASLVLPHGTGKSLKIAVLTQPEFFTEALNYGADIVGYDDLIANINKSELNFDVLITSPILMPKLAKLGKVLGPKGLMPSPKSGTITHNLKDTINEFRKGKIEYRADKTGIIHINFGKINFSVDQLKDNLLTIYKSIEKNKPKGIRGKYFKSFAICVTMGPSIFINPNSFKSIN